MGAPDQIDAFVAQPGHTDWEIESESSRSSAFTFGGAHPLLLRSNIFRN